MTGPKSSLKMANARPADDATGPDTVVIAAHGRVDNAVRSHHQYDWAVEAGELDLLIPASRRRKVTDQMRLNFTQFR